MYHLAMCNPDRAVELAQEHKLYHPDGGMQMRFPAVKENRLLFSALLLYCDGLPVGILLYGVGSNTFDIWVNPEHRGQGWGEKMVRTLIALAKLDKYVVRALYGKDREKSRKFWNKCGVYVTMRNYSPTPEEKEGPQALGYFVKALIEDMQSQGIEQHSYIDWYFKNMAVGELYSFLSFYTPRA